MHLLGGVRHDDELTVLVEDNSVGFDPAALGPEAGIGLRNVATRLAYLGGQARFDAAPGRGTTVTLGELMPSGDVGTEATKFITSAPPAMATATAT